jgi:TDG/mug DNA glycosylase family protein
VRSSFDISARIGAVPSDRFSFDDPDPTALPLALADRHRAMEVGEQLQLRVASGGDELRLGRVVEGAGFSVDRIAGRDIASTRLRTLPDTVGAGMRVLVVGLNPSVYAADRGVGFARPGNRFWPAAIAAGLVTRDRDPRNALLVDRVGMTDLVKRATARADELSRAEYRAGAARVEALVDWLRPGAVGFVGLTGYRSVFDRTAVAGWQLRPFGGRPAYLMPNPSGINAHATPAVLAAHLGELGAGAR